MTVLKHTTELDLLYMLLVIEGRNTGNFFERRSEVVGVGVVVYFPGPR